MAKVHATLGDLFKAQRALVKAARDYSRAADWFADDSCDDNATRLALSQSALDDAALAFAAVKAARKVSP